MFTNQRDARRLTDYLTGPDGLPPGARVIARRDGRVYYVVATGPIRHLLNCTVCSHEEGGAYTDPTMRAEMTYGQWIEREWDAGAANAARERVLFGNPF